MGFSNCWFPAWGACALRAGTTFHFRFCMLAPFEVIGHRVQATPGPGGMSFARLLVLADADPFAPAAPDGGLRPDAG